MKALNKLLFALVACHIMCGCYGNSQDTPEDVVSTFAQCVASNDIEGALSCFEYGEELSSLIGDCSGNGFYLSDIQNVISAADKSQLLPDISYEIIDSDVHGDKGNVRVKFSYTFDDGENTYNNDEEIAIPVYFNDGQWWIGESYSKNQREMARRGLKFLEKLGSH